MKTSLLRGALILAAAVTISFVTNALAAQPHMDAALGYLQQARAELQQAEHNKAGWRVKALKDLDQVIADVQAGKAAAN